MSTFTTSRRTRGQHVSPKISGYRQSPTTRLHIYGKPQGLPDRRDPMWWRVGRIIILACVLYAIKLTVVG